jgi:hypothetical protein
MAKTKESRMTVTTWSLVGIFLIVALPSVPLIPGPGAYAETRKASGVTESVEPLAQDQMIFPKELIFIHFRIQLWVLRSGDPDWDKARAFTIRFDHPNKATWFEGYSAITHPGGDQTFVKFEGKEESLGAKATYEAKGRIIGGTGKFKGITGTSTFFQTWTLAETTTEWETEYKID